MSSIFCNQCLGAKFCACRKYTLTFEPKETPCPTKYGIQRKRTNEESDFWQKEWDKRFPPRSLDKVLLKIMVEDIHDDPISKYLNPFI